MDNELLWTAAFHKKNFFAAVSRKHSITNDHKENNCSPNLFYNIWKHSFVVHWNQIECAQSPDALHSGAIDHGFFLDVLLFSCWQLVCINIQSWWKIDLWLLDYLPFLLRPVISASHQRHQNTKLEPVSMHNDPIHRKTHNRAAMLNLVFNSTPRGPNLWFSTVFFLVIQRIQHDLSTMEQIPTGHLGLGPDIVDFTIAKQSIVIGTNMTCSHSSLTLSLAPNLWDELRLFLAGSEEVILPKRAEAPCLSLSFQFSMKLQILMPKSVLDQHLKAAQSGI